MNGVITTKYENRIHEEALSENYLGCNEIIFFSEAYSQASDDTYSERIRGKKGRTDTAGQAEPAQLKKC